MSRNVPIESYGSDRPGRAVCECQYPKHPRSNERDGWCNRIAGMHNGMFLCGPCWRGEQHRRASFEGKDPLTEYVR